MKQTESADEPLDLVKAGVIKSGFYVVSQNGLVRWEDLNEIYGPKPEVDRLRRDLADQAIEACRRLQHEHGLTWEEAKSKIKLTVAYDAMDGK